ncbi:MAG: FHA domain-containing protein [Thermoguttaceae bacterium]
MKLELIHLDSEKPSIVLDQFPVIVGLDPGADICLDDSAIGHYQCMIDDADGLLTVWDLGTKLGTVINGVRISQKATLRPGDEIGIGRHRFLANFGDEKPSRHGSHDVLDRYSRRSAVAKA